MEEVDASSVGSGVVDREEDGILEGVTEVDRVFEGVLEGVAGCVGWSEPGTGRVCVGVLDGVRVEVRVLEGVEEKEVEGV